MPRRTPDQGVQPFEVRPGTEEVPVFRGMNRSADPASIPKNQFHLLVNARLQPSGLRERPGLVEELDTESGVCVTGLIETTENTGGGGPLRGLVLQFYGGLEQSGLVRWFHLGPEVAEPFDPSQLESQGINLIPHDIPSAYLFEQLWPGNGTRAIYQGPSHSPHTTFGLSSGPFRPFSFQGNSCALGLLGSGPGTVALFALTGADNGSAGAMNTVGLLGTYGVGSNLLPQSVAVREEIIGGEVLEVLYIGAFNKVVRFDGTTLTEWFTNPSLTPGSLHVFADGQEILILHNPSTLQDDDATIYYQPFPGAAITTATLPANLFEDAGNPGFDQGGWTGAVRFRGSWYVFFEGGQQQLAVPPGARTPFSGVISAVGGGGSLTFAQVFQSGPGVHLDGNTYYHIGSPIVWQDQIVFLASQTLIKITNGGTAWHPDDGSGVVGSPGRNLIGNWTDASGWRVPAVGGPTIPSQGYWTFDQYYALGAHGFHLSVGNRYLLGFGSYTAGTEVYTGNQVWGQPWPNATVRISNDTGQFADGYPAEMCAAAFFADDGAGEEG